MTEPEPPAPKPVSQLSSPPQPRGPRETELAEFRGVEQPVIADALRALGPDYEEALVNSIAERVDELARQREARARTVAAPAQSHPPFPGAPAPLPIPAPAPPPAPAAGPQPGPHRQQQPNQVNAGLPVSILSIIFGFIMTVVALTAGFSDGGPWALVAILIIWTGLVVINLAIWRARP